MGSVVKSRSIIRPAPGNLTASTVTDSAGRILTVVSDDVGELARLTPLCKTILMRGQTRTLTHQKGLFNDQFTRTVVDDWGSSPGGGSWGNVNGSASDYQVAGGVGTILCSTAAVSRYMRLTSDTDIGRSDVRLKVAIDSVPTGASNSCSLLLAYQSNTDNYRLRLTFNTSTSVVASIVKAVGDVETTIASASTIGTGFVAGDVWNIRGTWDGNAALAMYAWKEGDAEPVTPTRSGTDGTPSWTTGRLGVRVLASSGATNDPKFTFEDFNVVEAVWVNPPTVIHNKWVRYLSAPFTGVLTPQLIATIRQLAVDTTPDVLGTALEYVARAPAATSATYSAQITGQSGYGPLTASGGRTEGGDFYDYMGISWTFGDAGGSTANPDASFLLDMDCSGYLRMVAWRLGIPLARSNSVYFDGLNLPRVSNSQALFGPGIIVVQAVGTAPALTDLQIGDWVAFDATNGGDEPAGQLDHIGIFVGVDILGNYRFLSSRKTPNGPTMGDLGGVSYFSPGSALYATSLRLIRRP
jgi:hypothetical protein